MKGILLFVFAVYSLHVAAQQAPEVLITTTQGNIISCRILSQHDNYIYYTTSSSSQEQKDSIDVSLIASITTSEKAAGSSSVFTNSLFNRDGSNTLSAADKKYMDSKVQLMAEMERTKGKSVMLAGVSMLAASVALLGASAPFYLNGDEFGVGLGLSCTGASLFIPGIVMLPVGAVKLHRAKIYHKQPGKYGGTEVAFTPSAIAIPSLGTCARGGSIILTF